MADPSSVTLPSSSISRASACSAVSPFSTPATRKLPTGHIGVAHQKHRAGCLVMDDTADAKRHRPLHEEPGVEQPVADSRCQTQSTPLGAWGVVPIPPVA